MSIHVISKNERNRTAEIVIKGTDLLGKVTSQTRHVSINRDGSVEIGHKNTEGKFTVDQVVDSLT